MKNKIKTQILLVGGVFSIIMLGIAVSLWSTAFSGLGRSSYTSMPPSSDVLGDNAGESVQLVYVIDGDTIKVNMDGEEISVRLIGIDTPELNGVGGVPECLAEEAKAHLTNLLGGPISLKADNSQDDKDRYGRLLRYVFLADATNINEQMIRDGYAYEYTYNIPYQYQQEFTSAQATAEQAAIGLWGDSCDVNVTEVAPAPAPVPTPIPAPVPRSVPTPVPPPAPAPVAPPPAAAACQYSCTSPDRNCSDFATQAQAQTFFNCCGFTAQYDPMKLDGAGVDDGIACESLP